MNSLISIIVPIYNVEAYLEQCLHSLIHQTYKDLEIILVDDGSTDTCPQLCDEYAQKDQRIKVIHKRNGGLSSARNAGLDIATGDFIAFVDSDDWVDLQMYEHLMSLISKYHADVATCAVCDVVNGNKTKPTPSDLTETVYRGNDLFDKLFDDTYNVRSEVWNKVYTRSILGDLRFKEGQIYEDLYFDRILYSTDCLVAVSNNPMYYYRINRAGSTNSFFKRNRFSMFDELDDYIAMFRQQGRQDLADQYEAFAIGRVTDFYSQAIRLKADKQIRDDLMTRFENYYRNADNNPYVRRRMNYKLFSVSPRIYYYLRSVYSYCLGIKK